MLFFSRVKEATEEFIKILRMGRSDIQTADAILPFGINSKPNKSSVAVYGKTSEKGEPVILGYLFQSPDTSEGETTIYAKDSSGNTVFEIKLKNDGTCEFGGDSDFMVRFNELKSGFDELKSDFNNFINNTYNIHQHPTAALGAPSPPTITGSSSFASIDSSKINEIKTL